MIASLTRVGVYTNLEGAYKWLFLFFISSCVLISHPAYIYKVFDIL